MKLSRIGTYRAAIAIAAVSALFILIAVWFGGRERWRSFDFGGGAVPSEERVGVWEKRLEEEPEALELRYNLGCHYYQKGEYEKAEEMFRYIVDSNGGGNWLQKSAFYNLGNTAFRFAEKTEEAERSLSLYRKSLEYYRGGIEWEERERKFSDKIAAEDPDLRHNYALALKRIKILADRLRKRQKESADRQELFRLLKEIREREAEILSRLSQLAKEGSSEKSARIREELLEKRNENMERLKILKDRISSLFPQPGPAQPKASGPFPSPGPRTI